MCLIIILGWIVSVLGVPWPLRSTVVLMQLPYQNRHCQCSVTTVYARMLAVVALKQPTKECLTLVLSREMNGVTLSIVTLGTIRPRDREPCFVVKKPGRLGMVVNPLDMPRTPYWASERKPSTTHHVLSSHPHIIICTSFISSMDCTVL